jgi:hypothetical protein
MTGLLISVPDGTVAFAPFLTCSRWMTLHFLLKMDGPLDEFTCLP